MLVMSGYLGCLVCEVSERLVEYAVIRVRLSSSLFTPGMIGRLYDDECSDKHSVILVRSCCIVIDRMREGIFILLLILIICQSIATVKADEISVNELMQDEFAGEGFGDQYGYDEPEGELEERSEPNAATELQSWEEIEAFVKVV